VASQGVVEFDTEVTSNITGRITRLYEAMKIEVIRGITFKVKKASHLVGALIYCSKELALEGTVVVLKGWEQTWIDKQVKDNVKNIPYKMLKKLGIRLTQGTGPAMIYEWCKANNMQVRDKTEYLEVAVCMSEKGYMFGSVRHVGLYQDVCSLFGEGGAVRSVIESDLRFLE